MSLAITVSDLAPPRPAAPARPRGPGTLRRSDRRWDPAHDPATKTVASGASAK